MAVYVALILLKVVPTTVDGTIVCDAFSRLNASEVIPACPLLGELYHNWVIRAGPRAAVDMLAVENFAQLTRSTEDLFTVKDLALLSVSNRSGTETGSEKGAEEKTSELHDGSKR
jgi:hypothetical protein